MQVIVENAPRFLEEMNTKAIASNLGAQDLIPQDVQVDISQSKTRKDANYHLLTFLKERAATEQVLNILEIAAKVRNEGRMNAFADILLQEIQEIQQSL